MYSRLKAHLAMGRLFTLLVSIFLPGLTLLQAHAQVIEHDAQGNVTRVGIYAVTPDIAIPSSDSVSVCDQSVDGKLWSQVNAMYSAGLIDQVDLQRFDWSRAIVKLPPEAVELMASGQPYTKRFPVFIDIAGNGEPPESRYLSGRLNFFASQGFIAIGFSGSTDFRGVIAQISRPLRARCLARWLRRQGYLHRAQMQAMASQIPITGYLDGSQSITESPQVNMIYLPVDPENVVVHGHSLGGTTAAGLALVSDSGWNQVLNAIDEFSTKLFTDPNYSRYRPPYIAANWIELNPAISGVDPARAVFADLLQTWSGYRSEVEAGMLTESSSDFLSVASGCQHMNSITREKFGQQQKFLDLIDLSSIYGLTLPKHTCGVYDPAAGQHVVDIDNPERDANGVLQVMPFTNGSNPVFKSVPASGGLPFDWDTWRHNGMSDFMGIPSAAKGNYFYSAFGPDYGKRCLFWPTQQELNNFDSSKELNYAARVADAYSKTTVADKESALDALRAECDFFESTRLKNPGTPADIHNSLVVDLDPIAIELADILSSIKYAADPNYQIPMMEIQGLRDPKVLPTLGIMSARMIGLLGTRKMISYISPNGLHSAGPYNDFHSAFAKVVTNPVFKATGNFELAFAAVRDIGPEEDASRDGLTALTIPIQNFLPGISLAEYLPGSQYYFCYLLNPSLQDCDLLATNQLIWE